MIVIGVGCGPGMITQEAAREVSRARRIYGSKRAVEMARDFIPPGCEVCGVGDYSRVRDLPEDSALLSTGDPMLAGLGFSGARVVPGISSMQVAFARLGLSMLHAAVVDAHGGGHADAAARAAEELKRGKIVFVIADPGLDVGGIAGRLEPGCRIAVCEDLGYGSERVETGTAAAPPGVRSGLFSLVVWRPEDGG